MLPLTSKAHSPGVYGNDPQGCCEGIYEAGRRRYQPTPDMWLGKQDSNLASLRPERNVLPIKLFPNVGKWQPETYKTTANDDSMMTNNAVRTNKAHVTKRPLSIRQTQGVWNFDIVKV